MNPKRSNKSTIKSLDKTQSANNRFVLEPINNLDQITCKPVSSMFNSFSGKLSFITIHTFQVRKSSIIKIIEDLTKSIN